MVVKNIFGESCTISCKSMQPISCDTYDLRIKLSHNRKSLVHNKRNATTIN